MKKIILLLVSVTTLSCVTLPKMVSVQVEPQSEEFSSSNNQDDLYIKSNTWMVERFNSAKSVVQFSDKEGGIVIGKYLMAEVPNVMGYGVVSYTDVYARIKIQVKDEVAKITVTPEPFSIKYNSKSVTRPKDDLFSKQSAINIINDLILDYGNFIKNDKTLDFYKN